MKADVGQLAWERRLEVAEGKLRLMWILCLLELGIFIIGATGLLTPHVAAKASSAQVLRARGLIIEDAQGRPRILLGAPFPQVGERVRKDGQATALLLLGEDGADRLMVGEAPNPPIGTRIAPSVGVTIYDPKGQERGALALLGDNRAVVSLDRNSGDAIGLLADDKTDFAGFMANYRPAKGNAYPTALEIGVQNSEAFVRLKDCCREKTSVALEVAPNGTPSLRSYDAEGKEQLDLLRTASPPK